MSTAAAGRRMPRIWLQSVLLLKNATPRALALLPCCKSCSLWHTWAIVRKAPACAAVLKRCCSSHCDWRNAPVLLPTPTKAMHLVPSHACLIQAAHLTICASGCAQLIPDDAMANVKFMNGIQN